MSNTYTWKFPSLERAKALDGFTDVIGVVHWRLAGTDGVNTTDVYGTVALPPPAPGQSFTPYASITKEQVEAWTAAAIDANAGEGWPTVAELKTSLDAQLATLANPPTVTERPPFAD